MATPPFSFALVGAGRVGTAVAELLRRAGHRPVAVASRTPASARRTADLLETEVHEVDSLPAADVVLIGTPDGAIEEVATKIAPRLAEGAVVVHFAGSLGIEALSLVGTGRAALHPVQACPDVDAAIRRIPGSAWGVTCSEGLETWVSDLVEKDLAGHPYLVPDAARPLWHSAAVVTSNGLSALLALGEALLGSVGIDDPVRVLGPLAAGTLANAVEGGGGGKTLTGPAVRGEAGTLVRHLDGIESSAPGLEKAYGLASRLIVETALHTGRIAHETAQDMNDLLNART